MADPTGIDRPLWLMRLRRPPRKLTRAMTCRVIPAAELLAVAARYSYSAFCRARGGLVARQAGRVIGSYAGPMFPHPDALRYRCCSRYPPNGRTAITGVGAIADGVCRPQAAARRGPCSAPSLPLEWSLERCS